MELIGRTNLGEGALDVNVTDYKKIPVIDPTWFQNKLIEEDNLGEFLEIVDKVLSIKPQNIEEEFKNDIRMMMDEIILGTIGFKKKDVKDLYHNLLNLVKIRETRAKNVKKEKKKYK